MSRRGPETAPIVVWLDLETSGSDETTDVILEVGAAICANEPEMRTLTTFSFPVRQDEFWWHGPRTQVVEAVDAMHDASDLWADCWGAKQGIAPIDEGLATLIAAEVRAAGGDPKAHVPVAGSGVSHFDRRFIRRHMPLTDARLSYWAYDVGVIRRLLDRVAPDQVRPVPDGGKAHRALADALDHRDEWVLYEGLLRDRLFTAQPETS